MPWTSRVLREAMEFGPRLDGLLHPGEMAEQAPLMPAKLRQTYRVKACLDVAGMAP